MMGKKIYEKPTLEVIEMQQRAMLCAGSSASTYDPARQFDLDEIE